MFITSIFQQPKAGDFLPALERKGGPAPMEAQTRRVDEIQTRRVDEIVYREDLYPRIEHSPSTVQAYAEQLENLPPIEVNQRNELIDGWHRWTAHKKNQHEKIRTIVTETNSDTRSSSF
jgi:hypothetical protein